MGWIIFGAVLILIIGLLMLRIGVRIKYNEQDGLSAVVCLWRLPLRRVYPGEKSSRRPRLSRFTPRAIRRRKEKEKKRAEKEKSKKTAKKKGTAKTAAAPKKKKTFSDKARLINQISRMILSLLSRFFSHLRTNVRRFRIRIGTDDAAKTAVAYGAASAAASYLFGLLEEKTDLRYDRRAVTGVYSDFLADSCDADIDITLSLRIHHLLGLALRAVLSYVKQNAEG